MRDNNNIQIGNLVSNDNTADNVPLNFTRTSSNGNSYNISKGQLNKLRIRPQILNEHVESSREIQGVVSSGNILGQLFKESHDNINGILLTLESAAGSSIDNFESYGNLYAKTDDWRYESRSNCWKSKKNR